VSAIRDRVLGAAVFVVFLCMLQRFSGAFELDRQQVLSGEIWRIWIGHLVHTNMTHLTLNIAAALIIYFGFFTRVKLAVLLAYGFVFSTLISVALLCVYPGLDWYNGLSGLLHALVVYFSIRLAREKDTVFWVGPILVWLKVLTETLRANTGYENLLGDMMVITEAHLVGVFMGTIVAIICIVFWREKGLPERPQVEANT